MILLDTHIVVWLAFSPDLLSTHAKAGIDKARKEGNGLAISDISLLELAMLVNKGRIDLRVPLESFLTEIEARFVVLPITGAACARLSQLPASYPKDPADRLIGATAQAAGMELITADAAIRRSKAVRTIW